MNSSNSNFDLRISLNEYISNRQSLKNNSQGSHIKESIRDAQKLLQEVGVSIPEFAKNKASPVSEFKSSESFQNQLKDLSKLITERQSPVETNLKRIRTLRSNKSISNFGKLPSNNPNKENIENTHPNIAEKKPTHVRESSLKQDAKQKLTLDLEDKLSLNFNYRETDKSEPNLDKDIISKKDEPTPRMQTFEQYITTLKSPTNGQAVKAFTFNSPQIRSIVFKKDKAIDQSASQIISINKTEVKDNKVKTSVEDSQSILTPKTEDDKIEVSVTNRVFNPHNTAKSSGGKEATHILLPDISSHIKEEKPMSEPRKATLAASGASLPKSTQETKYSSAETMSCESPALNFDKQIKNIFLDSIKTKNVSPFKIEPEVQQSTLNCSLTSFELPLNETSISKLSVDQAFVTVEDWLTEIGLQDLIENFKDYGYKYFYEFGKEFYNKSINELLYKLGIDKIGYQVRIMLKLKEGKHSV